MYKEKWFVNELLTMFVRLILKEQEIKHESANLATHDKERKRKYISKRKKNAIMTIKCDCNKDINYFGKKYGHIKEDFIKYKKLLEKKDTIIFLMCNESFILIFQIILGGFILAL